MKKKKLAQLMAEHVIDETRDNGSERFTRLRRQVALGRPMEDRLKELR